MARLSLGRLALFAILVGAGLAFAAAAEQNKQHRLGRTLLQATCNGADLPTVFPNVDWTPTCLNTTFTFNASNPGSDCLGEGRNSTTCSGSFNAKCEQNGVWQLMNTSVTACAGCTTKPSGSLPGNATWDCNPSATATVPNGANCSASCFSSYIGSGSWGTTCSDNTWGTPSGDLVCTLRACNTSDIVLHPPPNAVVNCDTDKAGNPTCTSMCLPGYVSRDYNSYYCIEGYWAAQGGMSCQPIACTKADLLAAYSQVSMVFCDPYAGPQAAPDSFFEGTACWGNCSSVGTSQVYFTCNANGTWSVTDGACPSDGCVMPPPSTHTSEATEYNCTGSKYIPNGGTCYLVCKDTYTQYGNSSLAAPCSNGVWSFTGQGTLGCSPKGCSNNTLPSLPANAVWDCPAVTPSGDVCTRTCTQGYTPCYTDPDSSVCTSTPQSASCFATVWSGPRGGLTCNPSPCGNSSGLPPLPANAVWSCPASTASGGNCTASTCAPNYAASGSVTTTCTTGQWGNVTGSINCTLITSPCNNASAIPAPPSNAVWTCPTFDPSGSSCFGSCNSGYIESGSAAVSCSSGVWLNVTSTLTCSPKSCQSSVGLPGLPPNAVWSCPTITASGSSCNSACIPGYNASGTVVATCRTGSWSFTGITTCSPITTVSSCLPTAIPSLSDANAAWPTNCSTGSAALPAGTICTASCAEGYAPQSGSTPPTTACGVTGAWLNITGGCFPKGCSGNPQGALVPNATWNCSPTAHGGTCNGTCDSGDVTNPPVALCDKGDWTYSQGACQPGSKVRYITVEAPTDFAAQFYEYLLAGKALEWLNEHIQETKDSYKSFVPQALWPYVESLIVGNAWPVDSTKFLSTKRRQLLAEQGKQAITIGFQLPGNNGGWLGSALDTAIDKVLQSQIVLVGLTGFIVRQAQVLQEPYPGYDYKTVTVGWSDPLGTTENPVALVDCNLFMDVNTSVYDPMCYRDKDMLSPEVIARLSQPKFTVCPGTEKLKATFPFVAPAPENIAGQVVLSAVVQRPGVNATIIPGVQCEVLPGSLPSFAANKSQATSVDVVCKRKNGASFTRPTSYVIVLLASFPCNNATMQSSAFVEVTIAARPVLAVKAQQPTSICGAKKRPAIARFNYTLTGPTTVDGGKWNITATARSPNTNATCYVDLTQRKNSTGVAVVRCKGNFKAKEAVGINLRLTAMQGSCTPTKRSAWASVNATAC